MADNFSVTLSEKDWDARQAAWRCPVLKIPGAMLREVFHSGKREDPRHYRPEDGVIFWVGPSRPEELVAQIELTKKLDEIEEEKLRIEREKVAIEHEKVRLEKTWKWATAIGSVIAFIAGLLFPHPGNSPSVAVPANVAPVPAGEQLDKSLAELVRSGRNAGVNYVIESIAMIVDLDAPGTQPGKLDVAQVNIVYNVFAMDPVAKFNETFHSMQKNVEMSRIQGPDQEGDLTERAAAHLKWDVVQDIAAGQRHTIVTSARYTYALPYPKTRHVHDFKNLGPNEDVWCYPNEEDVVGEIVLVIRSRRPVLAPKFGDLLLVDASLPTRTAADKAVPRLSVPDGKSNALYVLSGRWKAVKKGQYAELHLVRQ